MPRGPAPDAPRRSAVMLPNAAHPRHRGGHTWRTSEDWPGSSSKRSSDRARSSSSTSSSPTTSSSTRPCPACPRARTPSRLSSRCSGRVPRPHGEGHRDGGRRRRGLDPIDRDRHPQGRLQRHPTDGQEGRDRDLRPDPHARRQGRRALGPERRHEDDGPARRRPRAGLVHRRHRVRDEAGICCIVRRVHRATRGCVRAAQGPSSKKKSPTCVFLSVMLSARFLATQSAAALFAASASS